MIPDTISNDIQFVPELRTCENYWSQGLRIQAISQVDTLLEKLGKSNHSSLTSDKAWMLKGEFMMCMMKYAEAETAFSCIQNKSVDLHYKLMQCAYFTGNPTKVVDEFWKGLEQYRKTRDYDHKYRRGFRLFCGPLWMFRVSEAYQTLGQLDMVISLLEKLLRDFVRRAKCHSEFYLFKRNIFSKFERICGCDTSLLLKIFCNLAWATLSLQPTCVEKKDRKSQKCDFLFICLKKLRKLMPSSGELVHLFVEYCIYKTAISVGILECGQDLVRLADTYHLKQLMDALSPERRYISASALLKIVRMVNCKDPEIVVEFLEDRLSPDHPISRSKSQKKQTQTSESIAPTLPKTSSNSSTNLAKRPRHSGLLLEPPPKMRVNPSKERPDTVLKHKTYEVICIEC